MMKHVQLSIILLFFTAGSFAENYYISNDGDNSNNGLSPGKSFKNVLKIKELSLKPGDTIFLKAGDFFTGNFNLKNSGDKNKPIVVTSFGEGPKPVINGSIILSGFKKTGTNLYSIACKKSLSYLYADDKFMIQARYPNHGFLTMDGGGQDYLLDLDLPFKNDVVKGANVRMRVNNWQFEYRKVTSYKNFRLEFDSILWNRSDKYNICRSGWGYYLDNSEEFLDMEGEWFQDKENGIVYLVSKNAPGNNIEGSFLEKGIHLEKGVSHVEINNIQFRGYTSMGVFTGGDNHNIDIIGCKFSNIGQYGIFLNKNSRHINILENSFNQITGVGIKLLQVNNCSIERNQLKNIGTIPGYGIDGVNGAIGISVENEEKAYDDPGVMSHSNSIRYNYIDSVGYAAVRMDGHHSVCEKNIMKNGMLTLNDGAMFYCWGFDTSYTYENKISKNIIINSVGNTEGTPNTHKINHGIYIDARGRDLIIEDNIITRAGSGILLNLQTYGNMVENNLCYNNATGMAIACWKMPSGLNPNVAKNNIFATAKSFQFTISVINNLGTGLDAGEIDNNIYISPHEKYHARLQTVEPDQKIIKSLTLPQWQKIIGFDKSSTFFVPTDGEISYSLAELFINERDEEKTIILKPSLAYINVSGERVSENITLPPRSGELIFFDIPGDN